MTLPRETIAAYADGELEGAALSEVEAALTADPSLQAQVDAHRALKATLLAHFAPIAEAPPPEHLIRAVKGGAEVVDFAEAALKGNVRSQPERRWARFAGPALAASVVLALAGIGLSQRSAATYANGEIASALDDQLVETQSPNMPVRILLSFRDAEGRFCRGFSSAAQSGIACHDDQGWRFHRVLGGANGRAGEFRQAGSSNAELLAAMQDMAHGPALNAQGERDAVRSDWRK